MQYIIVIVNSYFFPKEINELCIEKSEACQKGFH